MAHQKASTALDHLRVLDLTRVRAGPTSTRILGDFGADVIRIEPPPGVDPNEGMSGERHGSDMMNLQRNKRSLTLNLKMPEGLQTFLELVKTADVVVENFRPDVKNRLGIDYESLKAVNPRIILASVSGFGQSGPYEKRAGFDQIAQGMGGLMSVTGEPDEGPMRAGIAVADSSGGMNAALGILIALAEREKSGQGQWVHTSLLESQIGIMDFQAAKFLVDGVAPSQAGNDHPVTTPMGVVQTSDGYMNIGVGGDGQWRALCDALGHPQWAKLKEFATGTLRYENRPACWELIRPVFKSNTNQHWLAALEKHGVPAGPIYGVDEVFSDPQVQHLGIAQSVSHPVRGDIKLVGQPINLSRTPASIVTPPPDAGEHRDEVLQSIGMSEQDIAKLKDIGAT
jgi:crotonobetainyl-CoA:carnitine CoA-transferase CaiB-like acyl-CoA transferase